ncbi:hypothetical protein CVT25_000111, partial [Psilocybe cyanescens]
MDYNAESSSSFTEIKQAPNLNKPPDIVYYQRNTPSPVKIRKKRSSTDDGGSTPKAQKHRKHAPHSPLSSPTIPPRIFISNRKETRTPAPSLETQSIINMDEEMADDEEDSDLFAQFSDPQATDVNETVGNIHDNLMETNKLMAHLHSMDALSVAREHPGIMEHISILAPALMMGSMKDLADQQAKILSSLDTITKTLFALQNNMESNHTSVLNKISNIDKELSETKAHLTLTQTKGTGPHTSANLQDTSKKTKATAGQSQIKSGTPASPNSSQESTTSKPANPNPDTSHHPSRLIVQFHPDGIRDKDKSEPETIVQTINEALRTDPKASHLRVVAARFNLQGNLIISTRADQTAAELITHANLFIPTINKGYKTSVRVDRRWYKIQVDGVSSCRLTIGGERSVREPESIHTELAACNPFYADIMNSITSPPRWMRTKEELLTTTRSSVVFAVDQERIARTFLERRTLAAFGRHCPLRAYQDRPPITQCKNCWGWDHKAEHCKEKTRCRLCSKAHKTEEHQDEPCLKCDISVLNGDSMDTGEGGSCYHNLRCANCIAGGKSEHDHAADSRQCPTRIEKYGTVRDIECKSRKAEDPWTVATGKKTNRRKPKQQNNKPTDNGKPSDSQNRFQTLADQATDTSSICDPTRITHKTDSKHLQIRQPIQAAYATQQGSYHDDFDLIILQEPAWGYIGKVEGKDVHGPVALAGWTPIIPVTAPPPDFRPRTMAYSRTRSDFSLTLRTDILEDKDIQILDVTQPGHDTITIINVYNDTPAQGHCILNRLRLLELSLDHPTIITGDFNLHHTLWSTDTTPLNAHTQLTEDIVEWLSGKGFLLLNKKGKITHPARNSREHASVIDLSFVNGVASANDTFKDWAIDPSIAHDSDHFGIKFTIDQGRREVDNPCGVKYNLKETKPSEWLKAFEEELAQTKEVIEPLYSQESLNADQLDIFNDAITDTIQRTTSRVGKVRHPSTRAKPWWDADLKEASDRVAMIRREQHEIQALADEFKKDIRTKIRRSRNFFRRLSTSNDIWSFPNWSKGARNYPTPPISRSSGQPKATTHEEKCEALWEELYQQPPPLDQQSSGQPKATTHEEKCEALREELYQQPPPLDQQFIPDMHSTQENDLEFEQ